MQPFHKQVSCCFFPHYKSDNELKTQFEYLSVNCSTYSEYKKAIIARTRVVYEVHKAIEFRCIPSEAKLAVLCNR